MLGDKAVLERQVQAETGQPVAAAWEARIKTGESVLQKTGLLCATPDSLAFVEDRFGKPGEFFLFPVSEIRTHAVEGSGLRVILTLDSAQGPASITGRDREGLDRLLAAAGLAAPSPPAPAPQPARAAPPPPVTPPPRSAPSPPSMDKVEALRRARKAAEELEDRVSSGDREGVRELLDQGADLETRFDEERTPLMKAIDDCEPEMACFLIERGADIHARDEEGQTPLTLSAYNEDLAAAKMLLARGADVNAQNTSDQQTALMQTSDLELTRALIGAGASLEIRDDCGQTALANAARLGEDERVQALLEAGADPSAQDDDGATPLDLAREENYEVVMALLERAMAGGSGSPEKAGAGVEALRRKKKLAEELFDRVDDEDLDSTKALLQQGAEVDSRDDEERTPLMVAAEYGYMEILRYLLDQGADIAAADEDGKTPLLHAAYGDEIDAVTLLLSRGANVNVKERDDEQTALVLADDLDVIRALLDAGADLESRDDCGQTALAIAARLGEDEKVQLLLERGADLNTRDDDGMTPLDLARDEKEKVVVALLESFGAGK